MNSPGGIDASRGGVELSMPLSLSPPPASSRSPPPSSLASADPSRSRGESSSSPQPTAVPASTKLNPTHNGIVRVLERSMVPSVWYAVLFGRKLGHSLHQMKAISCVLVAVTLSLAGNAAVGAPVHAQKPRARALGIPFDGTPGPLDAITDVGGVTVGYTTLNRGKGAHAVRTGVTAVVPRGRASADKPVFAGVFSLNGNGELTGSHW